MSFPDQSYGAIAQYVDAYADQIGRGFRSVSRVALDEAQCLLVRALEADAQIFCCGNGGSAAIANHLVCDHIKGISADTDLEPRVHSLSANTAMITAIANDIDYAEVFAWQVGKLARPGDVLISISSSGDSENIVRALVAARDKGMKSIAMTGFGGGRSAGLADVNLHVDADNYGVVEDVHQSLMHILAQFIRLSRMPADLISSRKF